jgi:hypothetical protein
MSIVNETSTQKFTPFSQSSSFIQLKPIKKTTSCTWSFFLQPEFDYDILLMELMKTTDMEKENIRKT